MKKVVIMLGSILFALSGITPAAAATAVVTLDKTQGIAAPGESVGVKITNFPQRAGVYLMQCVESTAGARPTICNTAVQLWISVLPGASFTPTAAISMKLDSQFGTTNCTEAKCGVFIRLDHTAPGDFSEDQFIPITFAQSTQSIGQIKSSLRLGKTIMLPSKTDSGSVVKYRVAKNSTGICVINKGVVRAIKSGTCNLTANAPESNGKAKLTQKISIKVRK